MKKILTLLLLVILFTSASFAQGLYIRAGGGYGFPIGTSSIGEKLLRTENNIKSTYAYSAKNVTASYGAGADFNFSVGYQFKSNITFDLGFQYLISNKFETYNNYTSINTGYTSLDNDITKTSAKAFLINPSIILSAGSGKGIPYARLGIIVGSPTITKNESVYNNGDGISASEQTWLYKKGIALGYQGAVGMNWKLADKLDLFTEVGFTSMTYYASESNMTKYLSSNDGKVWTNTLPNIPISQKQTIYKNSFDPNVNNDGTKPTIALKEAAPFSSLSLNVGIRFLLWKKKV